MAHDMTLGIGMGTRHVIGLMVGRTDVGLAEAPGQEGPSGLTIMSTGI